MESCIVILAYISSHYFELLSFFLILRQKSKKITNCFQWVIKNKWSKCWDCSDMFVLVFTSFRPSFGRPLASARDRTLCGFLSPSYSLIKKTPFGVFSMVGMLGLLGQNLSSSSLCSDRPSDVRSHRLATEPFAGSYPLLIRS